MGGRESGVPMESMLDDEDCCLRWVCGASDDPCPPAGTATSLLTSATADTVTAGAFCTFSFMDSIDGEAEISESLASEPAAPTGCNDPLRCFFSFLYRCNKPTTAWFAAAVSNWAQN